MIEIRPLYSIFKESNIQSIQFRICMVGLHLIYAVFDTLII
jgi:hypothetical protein